MKTILLFLVLTCAALADDTLPLGLKQLFPSATAGVDYVVQDDGDGKGPRIVAWKLAQPQPSADQIAAAAGQARTAITAATQADAQAKTDREALAAKLDAGTVTAVEQRALIKSLILRIQRLEAALGR